MEALDTLPTYIRFSVIDNDPSAVFLPSTHQEKNRALDLLNYIDLPSGVAKSFIKIQRKIQREVDEEASKDALRSIVYEMGDYLFGSQNQHTALSALSFELNNQCPQPRVTIAEEIDMGNIDEGQIGVPALAQYVFIKQARGAQPDVYHRGDWLKTIEDRGSEQSFPDKNKTLYDVFTAPVLDDEVRKFIDDFSAKTTIKSARLLAEEAANNQQRRFEFWKYIIGGTHSHLAVRSVGKSILDSMGITPDHK